MSAANSGRLRWSERVRRPAQCRARLSKQVQMRLLVYDFVAGAVDRAGACENEPSDSTCLGYFTDDLGRRHVHVDGEVGIDCAGRITHQPAEMYHRSNTAHRAGEDFDVTEVLADDSESRMPGDARQPCFTIMHSVEYRDLT